MVALAVGKMGARAMMKQGKQQGIYLFSIPIHEPPSVVPLTRERQVPFYREIDTGLEKLRHLPTVTEQTGQRVGFELGKCGCRVSTLNCSSIGNP